MQYRIKAAYNLKTRELLDLSIALIIMDFSKLSERTLMRIFQYVQSSPQDDMLKVLRRFKIDEQADLLAIHLRLMDQRRRSRFLKVYKGTPAELNELNGYLAAIDKRINEVGPALFPKSGPLPQGPTCFICGEPKEGAMRAKECNKCAAHSTCFVDLSKRGQDPSFGPCFCCTADDGQDPSSYWQSFITQNYIAEGNIAGSYKIAIKELKESGGGKNATKKKRGFSLFAAEPKPRNPEGNLFVGEMSSQGADDSTEHAAKKKKLSTSPAERDSNSEDVDSASQSVTPDREVTVKDEPQD